MGQLVDEMITVLALGDTRHPKTSRSTSAGGCMRRATLVKYMHPVCGHERTDTMLFHVEIQKDWQDRDVAVEIYDVATDVRIAMAVARLTKERTPDVTPQVDMRQAA